MPEHQIENVVRLHDARAREDIAFIREIKPACPAVEKLSSVMAGVGGTFHGAVRAHSKKREADFTNRGTFDGSGHHILWHVDNFLKRLPDVALCRLGFAECQELYDFWRNRPLNTRTGDPLSAKHCPSPMGELDRFFIWLHGPDRAHGGNPNQFLR